jgi:hypothetical protein
MRVAALLAILCATACFREAAPCDQAGFDAVAETCVTDRLDATACNERLLGHEQRCKARIEAE